MPPVVGRQLSSEVEDRRFDAEREVDGAEQRRWVIDALSIGQRLEASACRVNLLGTKK
jgi:hypothetical protein